jgi:dihydroflavonol-4-reductase
VFREVFDIAAEAVGARRPRFPIPFLLLYIIAVTGDIASRLLRRDVLINSVSVKLMHVTPPTDHRKAVERIGLAPKPSARPDTRGGPFLR